MINRGGPNFVWRLKEETRFGVTEIAPAYALARDSFDFVGSTAWSMRWTARSAGASARSLCRAADRCGAPPSGSCAMSRSARACRAGRAHSAGISELSQILEVVLPSALQRMADRRQVLVDQGVPADVAERLQDCAICSADPISCRSQPARSRASRRWRGCSSKSAARSPSIGWSARRCRSCHRFHERMAINRTVDGILQTHRAIVARALRGDGGKPQGWSAWSAERSELLQRTRREIDELLRKRPFDLSRLTPLRQPARRAREGRGWAVGGQ